MEHASDEFDPPSRSHSFRDLFIGIGAGFALVIGMVFLEENYIRAPSLYSLSATTSSIERHRHLSASSSKPTRKLFEMVGKLKGTDKVAGADSFPVCLKDKSKCAKPDMENPRCRVLQSHFYHTMYNKVFQQYSTEDAEPFQFLEIGFYHGSGFDTFKEFLPRAEMHSIEIACLPEGPVAEGKWPWGNFPANNRRYQEYLDTNQLHCGDGSDPKFLNEVWTTKMKREGAPPLKVVVEDAAHLSEHMAQSLFFWFPRIEPGGIMVVEDIQPIKAANKFRTDVLPQVMKDLHYCGDPRWSDKMCFPTIQPLLHSIHCEMHICVFERNQEPAVEYSLEQSVPPPHALNAKDCMFHSHT